MFPPSNTPRPTELRSPAIRGWEALDRVGGRAALAGAETGRSGAPPRWRTLAGRALGLARAFITLDDSAGAAAESRPHERAESPAHPHRQPLRPGSRTRRPGAVAPRPHHCLTPVRSAHPTRIPGWSLH